MVQAAGCSCYCSKGDSFAPRLLGNCFTSASSSSSSMTQPVWATQLHGQMTQCRLPFPSALPLCLDPLPPPSALQPTLCCITRDTLISLSYLMENVAECTILGWKKIFMMSFEVKVVIILQLSTAAAEKPSAMVIVILEMCLLFPFRISGISSPPLAFWDFTWQTLASSVFGVRWNFIDSFPLVENLQLLLLFFPLLLCL